MEEKMSTMILNNCFPKINLGIVQEQNCFNKLNNFSKTAVQGVKPYLYEKTRKKIRKPYMRK
jgi:hypothetical protein